MDIFIAVVLIAALAVACFTDLREQKIPNLLTIPLMLSGVFYHLLGGGMEGFLASGSGWLLGFGVMFVPFLFGVMGAGDVKLMAAVGAWLGVEVGFAAFLFTCLAGGVYALIILMRNTEQLRLVLGNLSQTAIMFAASKELHYAPVPEDRRLPRLCYGVAIAVGSIASIALAAMEGGQLPS